jgi:hypothetical protein
MYQDSCAPWLLNPSIDKKFYIQQKIYGLAISATIAACRAHKLFSAGTRLKNYCGLEGT